MQLHLAEERTIITTKRLSPYRVITGHGPECS